VSDTPPYQAQTLSVKNMRTLLSYHRGEVPLDDREVLPLVRKGLAAWKHRVKRYGLTERGRILARGLATLVGEEIFRYSNLHPCSILHPCLNCVRNKEST